MKQALQEATDSSGLARPQSVSAQEGGENSQPTECPPTSRGAWHSHDKEAKSALQFLHHYAGVLMYFPELEELKDTVICDTQIVYDSATNLIVNTFKFGRVSMAASERFRETGQFSLEDIRRSYRKCLRRLHSTTETGEASGAPQHHSSHHPVQLPTPSQATSPQQFRGDILHALRPSECSHMRNLTSGGPVLSNPLSPAPLFIHYKCGYVPIGVFPAMIASLAGQESLRMIEEDIKKNRVQFRFGSDYDTVTLVSQPKVLCSLHLTRLPSA